MINLIKGIEKEVIYTLTESVTIADPVFVFELINTEDRDDVTTFTASDISTSTNRYNAFNFLVGDGIVTGATFTVEAGVYDYTVFESDGAVATTGSTLETGLMTISGASTTVTTSYTNNNNDYVYRG